MGTGRVAQAVDQMSDDDPAVASGVSVSSGPSRRVLVAAGAVVVALAVAVAAVILANRPAEGDPGRLSEPILELPSEVTLPLLEDVTAAWSVDDLGVSPAEDAMAGGAAVGDLDGDGAVELLIANGTVSVLRWTGSGYDEPVVLSIDDAIAVSVSDVDADGFDDALVARAGDRDTIVVGRGLDP